MNIAYVASLAPSGGVNKKVFAQMHAWKKQGHTVQSFFMCKQTTDGFKSYTSWKKYNLLNPHLKIIFDLYNFKPDCIYMREDTFSLFYIFLFTLFQHKIVIEINSDYRDEGMLGKQPTFTRKRVFFVNKLFNKLWYKLALGLVFVTSELQKRTHFQSVKNSCVVPNAIEGRDWPIRKKAKHSEKIRLFFIGSPNQVWHGLDILTAWAKPLGDKYEIHIVGMAQENIAAENVFFHGYLTDYTSIAENMDFGIGSLALFRNNLMEACPLKVREYLAMGLPVVLGYKDTAFMDNEYDFILTIQNIEHDYNKPETIKNIDGFCQKLQNYVIPYELVRSNIDIDALEKRRMESIISWLK